MKRRLIGLLFACSLVCASAVRAEVSQVDEISENDARGASSPFNQVIKQLNRVVCDKVDAVQEKVCDILDTTTLIVVPKLCDTLMTVTNIELLTTTTIIPKLCDVQDTVTTIENTVDTSLLPKVCSMLMSVTNIELLTTTTVVPKICTILDTVTSMQAGACDPAPITGPMNITVAGSYCVGVPITGDINISASCVTLDLNGYKVTGTANGISATGVNDIVIKNGVVTNAAGSGVNLNNVDQFVIEDIVAEGCNTAGVSIVGSCRYGMVRGCLFATSEEGLFIEDCDDIVIEECSSHNNTRGYNLGGSSGTVGAITCKNSLATASDDQGFLVVNGIGVDIIDCSAINNQFGFQISGASSAGNAMCRCEALDNTDDGFVIGFTDGASLSQCKAVNNGDRGFYVSSSSARYVVLHECKANHNGDSGFDIADFSGATFAATHVQECLSVRNTATGFHDNDPASTASTYVANFATGNATDYSTVITNVAVAPGVTFWENTRI